MPVISITPADIMRSKVLDPQWIGAKIIKVYEPESSKDKQSINYNFDFLLESDIAEGKQIKHNFNSKLISMVIPLMAACGLPVEAGSVDLSVLDGKKVDIHIYVDNYNGILSNKIDGFLPYGKGREAPAF